eukprot:06551.XXX_82911_83207_1 [CDS] Oithona nana genome sequencing.
MVIENFRTTFLFILIKIVFGTSAIGNIQKCILFTFRIFSFSIMVKWYGKVDESMGKCILVFWQFRVITRRNKTTLFWYSCGKYHTESQACCKNDWNAY